MKLLMRKKEMLILTAGLLCAWPAEAVTAKFVKDKLDKVTPQDKLWVNAPEETVTLMAQPTTPKPKETTTESVIVQALHNGEQAVFRVRWKDASADYGGRLAKFSDGVALQFPMTFKGEAPPIVMGAKGMPVHILHWRAQFEKDRELGRVRTVKELYPNSTVDQYPFDYKVMTADKDLSPETRDLIKKSRQSDDSKNKSDDHHGAPFGSDQRDMYSHGRAAGNPSSYPKIRGLDEIVAEGYGTSQVVESPQATAYGAWEKGEWKVVFIRPVEIKGRSTLGVGAPNNIGFAVWRGEKDEAGSRKSVTLQWIPLQIEKQ